MVPHQRNSLEDLCTLEVMGRVRGRVKRRVRGEGTNRLNNKVVDACTYQQREKLCDNGEN